MKLGILFFTISTIFFFNGCKNAEQGEPRLFSLENSEQQAFVNFLSSFCGQGFRGRQTYISPGRESWANKAMVIRFRECNDGKMAIAFLLGGDESRTWLLLDEDGRLRFRHDHRNCDGTPEEVTLYGGYAIELGSRKKQIFPADEYTCQMLPNACNAEWQLELTENSTLLSYSLFGHGKLLFKAEFDLSKPLNPLKQAAK